MGKSAVDFGQNRRPFIAGFMRGYRAWKMDHRQEILRPVSHPREYWIPGRNVAQCLTLKTLHEQLGEVGLAELRATTHASIVSLCNCGASGCNEVFLKGRLESLERHQVPSINEDPCNYCGFYGLHSPDFDDPRVKAYVPAVHMFNDIVYGTMKATGIIVVGEKGFRAQIGEVEALAGGVRSEIYAKKYGVPNFGTLEELVKEFPPTETGTPTPEPEPEPPVVIPNMWMSYTDAWKNWLTPSIRDEKRLEIWAKSLRRPRDFTKDE